MPCEFFQVAIGQKDWQEFAKHALYTCFSQVCKIDVQGWKVKEGKEQVEGVKNIISYACQECQIWSSLIVLEIK